MAEQNAEFNIAKGNFRISEKFSSRNTTQPGPRYTSYPTAPVWNDNFGVKDLESAYSDADAARRRSRSTCIFPTAKAFVYFAHAM